MSVLAATALIAAELGTASNPCVTSSFQASGMVLVHMLRALHPRIPVLFIDTEHHFAETYAFRERIAAEWKLNLVNVRASEPEVGLWRTSTESCCARHKVGPLFAALEAHDVWFAGLRREQSPTRAQLKEVASFRLPSGTTLRKVSPLAGWTERDVSDYAREHAIPLLPQYARGYTSIGCEPCTLPPVDPSHPRSGRWLGQRLECGIHIEQAGGA